MSASDLAELSEAVELQRKSYGLLLWMAERIRQGTFAFHATRHYGTAMEAAREWLRTHAAEIPPSLRPDLDPNG